MLSNSSSLQTTVMLTTASTNVSYWQGPVGRYKRGYHTLLVILALLIIIHNSFVLFLYMKRRTLHTPTNLLLASTACSDVFTGLLMIPFLVTSAALFYKGFDVLYFTSNVISDFLTHASVVNLLLVTLERYVSLCHPYLHPEVAKKSFIKGAVAFTWVFSFALAITPLSWSFAVMNGEDKDINAQYHVYSLVTLIGVFFAPTMMIIYCLISMFAVVRRFVKQDRKRGMSKGQGIRSQGKAVFVFLFMFLNMFICWSPLMIIRLAMDTEPDIFISNKVLEALVALRCCSSLVNPVIYVWCKKDFKSAFLRIVCHRSHPERAHTNFTRNTQGNKILLRESVL